MPIDTTWALEDVAAPLAWGCSTGISRPAVAVIDQALFTSTDLTPQLNTAKSVGLGFDPSRRPGAHGTRIAHLLAARGNDSVGMTGATWGADLRVYDPIAVVGGATSDPLSEFSVLSAIGRAARDGAKVINLSIGDDWTPTILNVPVPDYPTAGSAADSSVARTRQRMIALLTRLRSQGHRPLLVVAAGNRHDLDSYWSRYTAAASDPALASSILVVGGSDNLRSRWLQPGQGAIPTVGSSAGTIVDVYAPASQVFSIDGDGTIGATSGTSDAAPLAAGTAALLFDFDPRLTETEVHDLIVSGATAARLPTDQVTVLNAYWALKKAAERPGAPLCGNVVIPQPSTANGGATNLLVTRGTSSLDTVAVISVPPDTAVVVDVAHGGRRLLRSLQSPARHELIAEHDGSGWRVLPRPWSVVSMPNITGSSNSSRGWSHDADSALNFRLTGVTTISAQMNISNGSTHFPVFKTFSGMQSLYTDPVNGILYGGAGGAFGTMSPHGAFAIVATHTGSSFGTLTFHRVSLLDGSTTTLFSDATQTRTIWQCQPNCGPFPLPGPITISEDGSEFWYQVATADWNDPQAGCALKRFSLKTTSLISVYPFTGARCLLSTQPGAARLGGPIGVQSNTQQRPAVP